MTRKTPVLWDRQQLPSTTQVESELCPTCIPVEYLRLQETCCCCLEEFHSSVSTERYGYATWMGIISCCSHTFHFECISRWASRENRCPQCKRRFVIVGIYTRTGIRLTYRWVGTRNQSENVVSDSTMVELRRSLTGPDTIVFDKAIRNFCFLCHNIPVLKAEDPAVLICNGRLGQCLETAHLECLEYRLLQHQQHRFFCPTCISTNMCITSTKSDRRVAVTTSKLQQWGIPDHLECPIETLALDSDRRQKLVRMYRDFLPQIATTSRKRKMISTTNEQPTAAAVRRRRVISHQQRRLIDEVASVDERPENPPPLRGVPCDFSEWQEFERTTLGHRDYGMHILSSRPEDGGALSGAEFLSSLLSRPEQVRQENERRGRKQRLPLNQATLARLRHETRQQQQQQQQQQQVVEQYTLTSDGFRYAILEHVRPSGYLLTYLKEYGSSQLNVSGDVLPAVVWAAAQSLIYHHRRPLLKLADPQADQDEYWPQRRDDLIKAMQLKFQQWRDGKLRGVKQFTEEYKAHLKRISEF